MRRFLVLDGPPVGADPDDVYVAVRRKAISRGGQVMRLRSPDTFRMLAALCVCSEGLSVEEMLDAFDNPERADTFYVRWVVWAWRKKIGALEMGIARRPRGGYMICDRRRFTNG